LSKTQFLVYLYIMHLISILGQTCSGKTGVSVQLAHHLQNQGKTVWIVGCDSRQVYTNLDIGTAKIAGQWHACQRPWMQLAPYDTRVYLYQGIQHFCIDHVPAERQYSVVDFVSDVSALFCQAPTEKLPEYVILTGGTGLWAQAIIKQYQLGTVRPEYQAQYQQLVDSVHNMSLQQLQELHTSSDYAPLNHSDFANPRRLQRSIIRNQSQSWQVPIVYPRWQSVRTIALQWEQSELHNRITQRIHDRIAEGLLKEVQSMQHLGRQRLLDLGLEYRQTQYLIEGTINRAQWIQALISENIQYAKRQLTWLKRMKIDWIQPDVSAVIEVMQ